MPLHIRAGDSPCKQNQRVARIFGRKLSKMSLVVFPGRRCWPTIVMKTQDLQESPSVFSRVRLKPSKLHDAGIGVFAVRRIPKNTKVFAGENEEILWRDEGSLPRNGELRRLYDDFAIIKGRAYGCPTSFNRLTPAWYLNESKKPNVRCDENYDFYSLREIGADEELTVDYATFSDYPDRHPSARRPRKPSGSPGIR